MAGAPEQLKDSKTVRVDPKGGAVTANWTIGGKVRPNTAVNIKSATGDTNVCRNRHKSEDSCALGDAATLIGNSVVCDTLKAGADATIPYIQKFWLSQKGKDLTPVSRVTGTSVDGEAVLTIKVVSK